MTCASEAREDQVVDDTFDQGYPVGGTLEPFDDGRAQAEYQCECRCRDDRDARGTSDQQRPPQTHLRLARFDLYELYKLAEVPHRLGQSPLVEPREDAAFELRHRVADMVSR